LEEFKENNELDDETTEKLRELIRDEVRNAKLKLKEQAEERKQKVERMPEAEREALRTMKVHKYYPQNKEPDLSQYKVCYSPLVVLVYLICLSLDSLCQPLLWQGRRVDLNQILRIQLIPRPTPGQPTQ